MRGLMLGVMVAVLAGGVAAAAEPDGSKVAPRRPAWGCKADHEPARMATRHYSPSKSAPRDGELYLLQQPAYCGLPQPTPRTARGV
jgi:hypothetical protein